MRWPWVSRATYDAHTQVLIDAQASLIQQNEWLRHTYESLLDKYDAIARPVPPTPTPALQAPHQEPSFVATIIRDQSKHDPRLAAYLKSYATQLKAEGLTEDEIGMALTQWTTTEALDS